MKRSGSTPFVPGAQAGSRVLVRPCIGSAGFASMETIWMGSDFDGAFAQLVKVPAAEMDRVRAIGADCVVDNVAGPAFGAMLQVLKRSGRFTSSGAIGGPLVTLDMRTFYLKDLTLIGCTAWDELLFPNLVAYIERGEIRPLVAKTFRLDQIADAQREFLQKNHVGNFVLIPPPADN